jgi:enoyl-CoA hydratase/carnithine racemase
VRERRFSTISLEVEDDGIAVVTLDRPESLNAFTSTMQNELIEVFDITDADDSVRAVIVTGRGRAFCADADLSSRGDTFDYQSRAGGPATGAHENRVHHDGGGLLTLRIFDSVKPVIAAVNGPAVGIGASMTLAMDAPHPSHRGEVWVRLHPSRPGTRCGCLVVLAAGGRLAHRSGVLRLGSGLLG